MRHTESREDGEHPSEGIADFHRNWDVLQAEHDNAAETARDKVQEQSEDLRIDVRRECEGPDVSIRHDSQRVE